MWNHRLILIKICVLKAEITKHILHDVGEFATSGRLNHRTQQSKCMS